MIQLFVNKKEIDASGALPVSWCVSRETLEQIKGEPNPHLLLITASHGKRAHRCYEVRQLVPLNSQMTYVSFKYAGENTIFAQIVTGDDVKRMEQRYLRDDSLLEEDGSMEWAVDVWKAENALAAARVRLEEIGDQNEDAPENELASAQKEREVRNNYRARIRGDIKYWTDRLETAGALDKLRGRSDDIDVPKEYFGREWPKPVMDWVNYGWGFQRPRDQCGLRKRATYAFTLQPFVVLGLILFRLFAALALFGLFGARGLSLKPVYRPLKYDTGKVWADGKGPFWLPVSKGDSQFRLLLIPLTPAFILVMMMFTSGVLSSKGLFLWVLYSVMGLYAVGLCIALAAGACCLLEKYGQFLNPGKYLAFLRTRKTELTGQDIDLLACDTGPKPLALKEVEPGRRTIRLRFLDTKAKVCKPLQG